MIKQFYFRQYNWTLSGAATLDRSEARINGTEGVLCIPQSSSITVVSPSDFFYFQLQNTHGGLTPLQRRSQCILQSQLTGLGCSVFVWYFEISKDSIHLHEVKIKESCIIGIYSDLTRGWITEEHECDGDCKYSWCAWKGPLRVGKGLEELEIREIIETIENIIIKICLNTQKCSRYLKKISVLQTSE